MSLEKVESLGMTFVVTALPNVLNRALPKHNISLTKAQQPPTSPLLDQQKKSGGVASSQIAHRQVS